LSTVKRPEGIQQFSNETGFMASLLLNFAAMKGTKEQPTGVSIFLAMVFLAGAISVFKIATAASKTGVVEMVGGGSGPTTLHRANTPEVFWMCVAIYALAGLGCLGGFVYQARNAIRKLRVFG
jgi:hypothetical protein